MSAYPTKAPSHDVRWRLRAMKGRTEFGGRVQRLPDPHADRSRWGWWRIKLDPRGFDPLEVMNQWRGRPHPVDDGPAIEYRRKAYAEARARAQLRMVEAAIGCGVAARAGVEAFRQAVAA